MNFTDVRPISELATSAVPGLLIVGVTILLTYLSRPRRPGTRFTLSLPEKMVLAGTFAVITVIVFPVVRSARAVGGIL